MKRIILSIAALGLSLVAFAQKAPRKAFSTELPPLPGAVWQEGDAISLSDDTVQGATYTATEAGGQTSFMGRGARRSDEGHWLALYPAAALRAWEANTLRFVIPHEQVADSCAQPVYSRTEGRELVFKPLTAYLKFELPAGMPPVKEIRFSANKYISGSYKADLGAKTVSVQLDTGTRYRSIVLTPGKDGVIAPGEYTLSLFARTLPDGLAVEVEMEDGTVRRREISTELRFALGKTRDLGILCQPPAEVEHPSGEGYPRTDIGKLLQGEPCPTIVDILWDTTYTVTSGLDYYQMTALTDAGEKQLLYLLRIDPSRGLDIKVAISDETTSSVWKRQTPAKMAARLDTPSNPVYAVINADFCDNREPIKPRGPVHCGGKIWAGEYSIDPKFPQQALSYVGVTFDGRMTLGPSSEYAAVKKTLKECTGAGVILIRDSVVQSGYVQFPGNEPRTAIGYTSDDIVWMLAVDGRHGTPGMTYAALAAIFSGLGCSNAVNLDGGGSTQMLVRDPLTDEIKLRNWPSDPHNGFGGRERPRLDAWMVVKK